MEVFHVVSIHADTFLIKNRKFRGDALKTFTKHPYKIQKFPKLQRILEKYLRILQKPTEYSKNFTKFYKVNSKGQFKFLLYIEQFVETN